MLQRGAKSHEPDSTDSPDSGLPNFSLCVLAWEKLWEVLSALSGLSGEGGQDRGRDRIEGGPAITPTTAPTLRTDPVLRELIPPLADDERAQLERNIVADGCRDPLVVWDQEGILLDGHNRLAICEAHGIAYEVRRMPFASRADAELWVLENQFGRRNLTPFVKIELALRIEERIAARAKANQRTPTGGRKGLTLPTSGKSISTLHEVAKIAGVGHDTVAKAKAIIAKADDATKATLRAAETTNVPAAAHFTASDDGLAQEWYGRVYMNPPYGRELPLWVDKLISEFQAGRVTEAVVLVPSRTDTLWFRRLREYPRAFLWGRLRFSDAANAATFPSMAVLLTRSQDGPARLLRAFGDVADVYPRALEATA
jgi:hypothetical protein